MASRFSDFSVNLKVVKDETEKGKNSSHQKLLPNIAEDLQSKKNERKLISESNIF